MIIAFAFIKYCLIGLSWHQAHPFCHENQTRKSIEFKWHTLYATTEDGKWGKTTYPSSLAEKNATVYDYQDLQQRGRYKMLISVEQWRSSQNQCLTYAATVIFLSVKLLLLSTRSGCGYRSTYHYELVQLGDIFPFSVAVEQQSCVVFCSHLCFM
jgi:hypothetical protein